jgi:sugar phosphate isomerase/epimerase
MTIPVILSSGSLYNLDVDTLMALAAETGFAGVEVGVDWRWETHRVGHLQKLIARHHLPILAIHSPFLDMPIQGWPDDPIARIRESVRLAERVGAQTVVVHPPERWVRFRFSVTGPTWAKKISLPLPLAGWGTLGYWLYHEMTAFQATTSIKIAVENMPGRPFGPFILEPHHFYKPQQLNHFQYLTLDTTHVGTHRVDLMAFYEQIKAKVVHIHLSNYNGQEHRLLSDGVLPLQALLQRLAADGFAGLISLELNAFDLQAEDETALRRNLQASLAFCQEALDSGSR